MTSEARKWRDHFEECERDQLKRFPLCRSPLEQLETPLLRAQFEIALAFFQKEYPLDVLRTVREHIAGKPYNEFLDSFHKATAFRADRATREAFYEHFALEPLEDYFCLRAEEWDDVFQAETVKEGWEKRYSTSWHEFIAVSDLKPKLLRHHISTSLPDNMPLETLFLRQWGTLVHPLGGDGGAELWHWDRCKFLLVRQTSNWIS